MHLHACCKLHRKLLKICVGRRNRENDFHILFKNESLLKM